MGRVVTELAAASLSHLFESLLALSGSSCKHTFRVCRCLHTKSLTVVVRLLSWLKEGPSLERVPLCGVLFHLQQSNSSLFQPACQMTTSGL